MEFHLPKRYLPLTTAGNIDGSQARSADTPILAKKQPKQDYYHALVYYDELKLTCWSIKALRGLITTAIESLLTANGGKNMQKDFPDPVAILTNTSL